MLVASTLSAALVVLAAPSAPTASASLTADRTHQQVKKVKVDPRLFGVHDAHLNSLQRRGTGAIRLWDTGTSWPQMQGASGPVDFTRLDQIVADAWANGTEVTFVAALTPSWALAAPPPLDSGHPDNTYPPRVQAFADFLQAVMEHYKNYQGSGRPGIANYQVWNEANIDTFWNGTPQQMAQLVKTAYDVRNVTDPNVKLIAPAMVTRLKYQQTGIENFYKTVVDGKPVWKYVDALSFNLYPLDRYPNPDPTRAGTPEDSMALLSTVKGILAKDHVSKSVPIWNTEINYGLRFGVNASKPAATIPAGRQVAYVIRTYLLNAARGVKRVDWYAYDMGLLKGGGTLGNTLLTDPHNRDAGTLLPAGQAFTRVQKWMKGTLIGTATKRPCIRDRLGTYTCTIAYATGMGRVYWNPYRTARVTLVNSATRKVNEYGDTTRVKGGIRLKVNSHPILVRSKR